MEQDNAKKARKSTESTDRAEESSDSREHSDGPRKSPKKPEQRKDFTCEMFKLEIRKLGKAHYNVCINSSISIFKYLNFNSNHIPIGIDEC